MKILKIFTFVAACFLMAACGKSDDASRVADKISAGEQLTQSDYRVMIDYCGKYAEEAQKIQNKINDLPVDSEESGILTDKMADLSDKYSHASSFFEKISNCTQDEVGAENVRLINKYAPLMWFSAPAWASLGETDVEGFIEDMPSQDSTQVISSGDGVVVP